MKKVLVTGATGFVGGYVAGALLGAGHDVSALVRTPSNASGIHSKGVKLVKGDVLDQPSLEQAVQGVEVVVHLVGIIREKPGAGFEEMHHQATVNIVEAARANNVARFVHMSALSTRPNARSMYHKTKWKAEEAVRKSGLEFVIFRPSVIFGPGDEFISMLAAFFKNPFFVPVIGPGKSKMQPVYAGDVGRCFAAAVDAPAAANNTFDLVGPVKYTIPQLLNVIGEHLGKRRPRIHLPIKIMKPAARIMECVLPDPPLTCDQITMIQEDNTGDSTDASNVFQIEFVNLAKIIPEYI